MKEIVVNKNEAGQRLDKWLTKYLSKAPKSFFYKMLRKKNITLNSKKAEGSEKLTEGDIIKLFLSDETIQCFQEGIEVMEVAESLSVLYEDDNVVFINKPVGMLSQKAKPEDISLVEILISDLMKSGCLTKKDLETFKPSVCNRLDRNTSGIVVAGKSLAGLQEMSELFANRSLHKYYRCIVKGEMKQAAKISGYLTKNEATNKVTVTKKSMNEEDSYIETAYQPITTGNGYTLLEVLLITGKTHQIRAHLASIGYPIVGDFKYGNTKTNADLKSKYGLTHQLLHAYRLEFPKLNGVCTNLSERIFICEPKGIFKKIQDALFKGGV